jgi:hypothetical protein
MQTKIPRHWPMIRCTRASDDRLRSRKAFREYEIKGGVREAVSPWVCYSLRRRQSIEATLVSILSEGIERSFRCEHVLVMVRIEVAPDYNAFYAWHRSTDYIVDVH